MIQSLIVIRNIPLIRCISTAAVAGASLHKNSWTCILFSLHISAYPISYKSLEVLTRFWADFAQSENISRYTTEFFSWNNSIFSSTIVYQFLQWIGLLHMTIILHCPSELIITRIQLCRFGRPKSVEYLLFLHKTRTMWFWIHSMHTRLWILGHRNKIHDIHGDFRNNSTVILTVCSEI